jgi:hypothetical protein
MYTSMEHGVAQSSSQTKHDIFQMLAPIWYSNSNFMLFWSIVQNDHPWYQTLLEEVLGKTN